MKVFRLFDEDNSGTITLTVRVWPPETRPGRHDPRFVSVQDLQRISRELGETLTEVGAGRDHPPDIC
jgi:hypothetical protein